MNKNKKLTKILNIKTFIVFAIIIFICVIGVSGYISNVEKKNIEKKKEQVTENPMKVYDDGKTADFSDYLDFCGWKADDIKRIVIGVKDGEEKECKYYFDDEENIEALIDKLESITFHGTSDRIEDTLKENRWSLQLISDSKEYSITIYGYGSDGKNTEVTNFAGFYKYYSSMFSEHFPAMEKVVGGCQLLYDEELTEYLYQMYEDNVHNITLDDILTLKDKEKIEIYDYFRYKHTACVGKLIPNTELEKELTNIFKFYIEGTDSYVELEKYNFCGLRKYVDGVMIEDMPANHAVVRYEIFNESGESIDFFESSKEDIEEFLK